MYVVYKCIYDVYEVYKRVCDVYTAEVCVTHIGVCDTQMAWR